MAVNKRLIETVPVTDGLIDNHHFIPYLTTRQVTQK